MPLALLSVAACLVLLVLLGHIPSGARWAIVVGNAAHGPVFAILAVIALTLMARSRVFGTSLWWRAVATFALAIVLGIAIEIAQFFIGRDAEIKDVMTDALGAVAGISLFVFCTELRRAGARSRPVFWISLLGFLFAAAPIVVPVVEVGAAYAAKRQRQWILMDANTAFGAYFVTAYDGISAVIEPLPAKMREPNAMAGLRVRPGSLFPWGLGLSEMPPDWRGKRFFKLQLVNSSAAPLALQLRISDVHHHRDRTYGFYSPIDLAPATSAIFTIPLSSLETASGTRHVDLSCLSRIVLYGHSYEQAREFYLVKMWLE